MSETPEKPIGPGNHDRAWNDPPLFSVQVNTSGKAPSKKLTGRVGFPINGASPPATAQEGYARIGISPTPPLSKNNITMMSMTAPPLQFTVSEQPISGTKSDGPSAETESNNNNLLS